MNWQKSKFRKGKFNSLFKKRLYASFFWAERRKDINSFLYKLFERLIIWEMIRKGSGE
jgi:hypothetical protein